MGIQGQSDRGAAAVEFALVAMLLLTILFGIFEGGRLWMIQGALSQAAREGAREMAIHDDQAAANGVITSRAADLGVTITPNVTPSSCTPGVTVRAEASADVGSLTGFIDPLFGADGTITLMGKAEMRCGG
ncbi:TadE/TadG family type IV pilus assembly protein [Ornithinimicrobium cavernae]|uniref:TadE/TadG family type IV pilus assembly protein n=1 Tax=Ornithinimicrobium cavernae TaxID=2666047 RepID=UPI000D68B74E|nr:TadE family protein [Ornithinimicrobium cavernae]